MTEQKVNIYKEDSDIKNGYLNLGQKIFNLDAKFMELIDDNEAQEILAEDFIDYVPGVLAEPVFNYLISKLHHGGRLTIGGIDLEEVCKACTFKQLTIPKDSTIVNEISRLLHDDDGCRKVNYTMGHISAVLQSKGLKIVHKSFQNYHYCITAQRQ